jgi:hypothetical protein
MLAVQQCQSGPAVRCGTLDHDENRQAMVPGSRQDDGSGHQGQDDDRQAMHVRRRQTRRQRGHDNQGDGQHGRHGERAPRRPNLNPDPTRSVNEYRRYVRSYGSPYFVALRWARRQTTGRYDVATQRLFRPGVLRSKRSTHRSGRTTKPQICRGVPNLRSCTNSRIRDLERPKSLPASAIVQYGGEMTNDGRGLISRQIRLMGVLSRPARRGARAGWQSGVRIAHVCVCYVLQSSLHQAWGRHCLFMVPPSPGLAAQVILIVAGCRRGLRVCESLRITRKLSCPSEV